MKFIIRNTSGEPIVGITSIKEELLRLPDEEGYSVRMQTIELYSLEDLLALGGLLKKKVSVFCSPYSWHNTGLQKIEIHDEYK